MVNGNSLPLPPAHFGPTRTPLNHSCCKQASITHTTQGRQTERRLGGPHLSQYRSHAAAMETAGGKPESQRGLVALRPFFVNRCSFGFLRFRIPVRTYLARSERVARVVE